MPNTFLVEMYHRCKSTTQRNSDIRPPLALASGEDADERNVKSYCRTLTVLLSYSPGVMPPGDHMLDVSGKVTKYASDFYSIETRNLNIVFKIILILF